MILQTTWMSLETDPSPIWLLAKNIPWPIITAVFLQYHTAGPPSFMLRPLTLRINVLIRVVCKAPAFVKIICAGVGKDMPQQVVVSGPLFLGKEFMFAFLLFQHSPAGHCENKNLGRCFTSGSKIDYFYLHQEADHLFWVLDLNANW